MKLAAFLLASPLALGLAISPSPFQHAWAQEDGEDEPVQAMPLPDQAGSRMGGARVQIPRPSTSSNPRTQIQQPRPGQLMQSPQSGRFGAGSGPQVDLPPAGRYGATPIEIP